MRERLPRGVQAFADASTRAANPRVGASEFQRVIDPRTVDAGQIVDVVAAHRETKISPACAIEAIRYQRAQAVVQFAIWIGEMAHTMSHDLFELDLRILDLALSPPQWQTRQVMVVDSVRADRNLRSAEFTKFRGGQNLLC